MDTQILNEILTKTVSSLFMDPLLSISSKPKKEFEQLISEITQPKGKEQKIVEETFKGRFSKEMEKFEKVADQHQVCKLEKESEKMEKNFEKSAKTLKDEIKKMTTQKNEGPFDPIQE